MAVVEAWGTQSAVVVAKWERPYQLKSCQVQALGGRDGIFCLAYPCVVYGHEAAKVLHHGP